VVRRARAPRGGVRADRTQWRSVSCWNDWKVHFAVQNGNTATSTRDVTGWPTIVNLRADPFEKAPHESGMDSRWYADNLWLFVPI
jgi:hypothetical protein